MVSRLSFKCGLPISSDFVPDVLSRFFPSCLRFHSNHHTAQLSATSRLSPQLSLNCVPIVSELPPKSSNCLPIGSLRFEFDTVTAFGLHSWVHCVRLSGCFSLPVSVPLVSPTLANGFRSLDACLHWSLFACLPVWLSSVRLSGCLLFAFTCFPSCFSYHPSPDLYICLPTHPFSIISLPQRWWLILLPVCLCACLPSFASDHVSPTSWVFPFICSPSGSVLFLFQHVFVCD